MIFLHNQMLKIFKIQQTHRLRSVEQAIGLMKSLQTSIVVEETWVEKQTEKLQSLPTATSARELDVSTKLFLLIIQTFL
jgi:hypothetical protein